MAALTVTAAQVLPSTGPSVAGIAGAAITPGQSVYFASSGKWLLAQGDGTAAEAGEHGYGIALTESAADGQPIVVALPGAVITLGAGAAPDPGTVYYPGDVAGGLALRADLGAADKALPLALGLTTNRVLILSGAYHAGAVAAA